MSAQHTQGRLIVRPHGGNWSASYEGYGATAYMGIVSDTGEVVALATAYSPNPFCEPEGPNENARRLVACWNACEGIPTEVLEHYYGDKGGLDAALDEASLRDHTTAAQQRDELLAFIEEWLGRQGNDQNYMTAKARAAIAKVKGGAA